MDDTTQDGENEKAPRQHGCLQKAVGAGLGLALGALAGIVLGLATGIGVAMILGVL